MRVAIIGAGFSGLAVCWHLLNAQTPFPLDVVVFDPSGIGGGCSGIAAGLLHTYAGLHAKLNWKGPEAFLETLHLLDIASKASNNLSPYQQPEGILRIANNSTLTENYRKCAEKFSHIDVSWWEPNQCQEIYPHFNYPFHPEFKFPGLFIKNGLAVDCRTYLNGLWQACLVKGAKFEKSSVLDLNDLRIKESFDAVVVATGAHLSQYPEMAHIPVIPVKGQIIELAWPNNCPDLPYPINSQTYIIMNPCKSSMGKSCFAGSTYELNFKDEFPDVELAENDIRSKIETILPILKGAKLIDCKAGIRASTPTHLPLIGQLPKHPYYWYITGMGSKGMLYHAFFGKQLANRIVSSLKEQL